MSYMLHGINFTIARVNNRDIETYKIQNIQTQTVRVKSL